MIAAVYTSRNESDIIECSLRHMLEEGVDLIFVADNSFPGEGTRDILRALERETNQVFATPDRSPTHYQPKLVSGLAEKARCLGADWIIAADCDEFWYAPSGRTIAETLTNSDYPDTVYAQRWLHADWDTRRCDHEFWNKVAFRARQGAQVANGNHDVTPGVLGSITGVLAVREIPYRGFNHFKRKVTERIATFDRTHEAEGGGWHMLKLRDASEDELRAEYDALMELPSIHDPIPSRTECRPRSQS